MGNENLCIFVGRLAADPETRATTGGSAVVNFRLAVNSFWKDRHTGEKKEHTEYIPIEVWGAAAQHAQRLLVRGREVYVRGRMKTRKWDDEGKDRYYTSIVCEQFQLVGPKPASAAAGTGEEEPAEAEAVAVAGEPEDDDIPF